MSITKDQLLDTVAVFTWDFCRYFHLETCFGNFEWSDPDYGGDNTIKPAPSYGDWLDLRNIEYGRGKGQHLIRDYCGEEIELIN